MFGNVVKPMVLATLLLEMMGSNGASNIIVGNVVKQMIPTTLFSKMLLELFVPATLFLNML